MSAVKPFMQTVDEQRHSSGQLVLLCALHEVYPSHHYQPSVEAITIFNGMAVCREHLTELYERETFMKDGGM